MTRRAIDLPDPTELETWVRQGLEVAAGHFRVGRTTVTRWCRRMNIRTNPSGRKPGPQPPRPRRAPR